MDEQPQYLSAASLEALKKEYEELKDKRIPEIAKRIDEAKQQGDLSENAEYHQAREDMSWAQGRASQLEKILSNVKVIAKSSSSKVQLGSTVTVEVNKQRRQYTIVGATEADPAHGAISHESPLGNAFLNHEAGDGVEVTTPAGRQIYRVIEVK